MKKTGLIFILFFATQVVAGPKHKGDKLNLSADQKVQMQAVKENMHKQLEAAREEIKLQAHKEMATFLTAEQVQQIKAREQHRQEHKAMRQEHRSKKKGQRKIRKAMKDAD